MVFVDKWGIWVFIKSLCLGRLVVFLLDYIFSEGMGVYVFFYGYFVYIDMLILLLVCKYDVIVLLVIVLRIKNGFDIVFDVVKN